ncbi:MAG TPA: DUF2505 family protein [Polyangiaceae bacterium]|jgi:hypothetical protein|nr:DUF2505 family protein [Polyangiaceae bacterium]
MSEIRVEHVFKCSEETFWTKVFFDDEYNRRLFQEILKFPVWRVLKSEEQGDEVHRTIEAAPPIGDLPGALKAVVGDSAGYEERGVFNKKTHKYRVEVVPNRMSDKISVVVDMWTEPLGDKECKRFAKATATAKIFGVGGLLEKKLLGDLERSYAKSAAFTNTFVAEKGL